MNKIDNILDNIIFSLKRREWGSIREPYNFLVPEEVYKLIESYKVCVDTQDNEIKRLY